MSTYYGRRTADDAREQLRADSCRMRAWASLFGSSADALRFNDTGTYAVSGDPDASRARLPYSRRMAGEIMDARLRELGR